MKAPPTKILASSKVASAGQICVTEQLGLKVLHASQENANHKFHNLASSIFDTAMGLPT